MDKQISPNFNRDEYRKKLNDFNFARDEMGKFLNRAKEILDIICWHVENSDEPYAAPELLSELFEMFSIGHKNFNYTQFAADLQVHLFDRWTSEHTTYFLKWRKEIFKDTYFKTDNEFLKNAEDNEKDNCIENVAHKIKNLLSDKSLPATFHDGLVNAIWNAGSAAPSIASAESIDPTDEAQVELIIRDYWSKNNYQDKQGEQVLDLSSHTENLNIFDAEKLIKKYELPKEVEQALRECAEKAEVKSHEK